MEKRVDVLECCPTTEGMSHDAHRAIDGSHQPQLLDGMDHIVGAGLQGVDCAVIIGVQCCAQTQRVLCRGAAVTAQIQHKGGQVRMCLSETLGGHPQILARAQQTMEEEDGPTAALAGCR